MLTPYTTKKEEKEVTILFKRKMTREWSQL